MPRIWFTGFLIPFFEGIGCTARCADGWNFVDSFLIPIMILGVIYLFSGQ